MSQAYFRDGLGTVSSESGEERKLPRHTEGQPVWPEGLRPGSCHQPVTCPWQVTEPSKYQLFRCDMMVSD